MSDTSPTSETPSSKPLHVYTKVALAAAIVAGAFNLVVAGFLVSGSAHFFRLTLNNIWVTGLASMVAFCLGIDAMIKYRWPGETAAAHARRPQRNDLVLVVISLSLCVLSIAAMLGWLVIADALVRNRQGG